MIDIRKSAIPLALISILLVMPSIAYAWAKKGHEIVAMIAEERLQPDVREKVDALLGRETFIDAANWADKVRNEQTAPWHYVNIPITETKYEADRVCPKNRCITGQIERFRGVLANESANFKKRQKALKYLTHLIADLHQPLHAGENHDHGGNDVQVEFLGQTINPYNHKPWNLHSVWDSGILEAHDPDPRHYAERLSTRLKTQPEGIFQEGSVVDWAMESHDIARDHVYIIPENRQLGEEYYRDNVAIVDQQLAKAGVRLAKILNEALAKNLGNMVQ